jgi:hypothetical protein
MGASVVELDTSVPFTAARARNTGFARLVEIAPEIEAVQFIDGDCEVVEGWLNHGILSLQRTPLVGVVSGRRREQNPQASIYNRLINMEWGDQPVGEVEECHGDAMMRRRAFEQVNGFNPTLIAGEEPDLCMRMRERGWKILKLDVDMTRHDAAMTRFSQFWKRTRRAGHAYAEQAFLNQGNSVRNVLRPMGSIVFWGLAMPASAIFGAPLTAGASVGLLGMYALLGGRVFRHQRRRGYDREDAAIYATFVVFGKFPQAIGAIEFMWNRVRKKHSVLIEYKEDLP